MFKQFLLQVGLTIAVEEAVAYGTVHTISPQMRQSYQETGFNLVNRVTERSSTLMPMLLSNEIYWKGPSYGFSASHVIKDQLKSKKRCEYGGVSCTLACFNKTATYYSWSKGTPVSSPETCEPGRSCSVFTEYSTKPHLKTNFNLLSEAKLLALVSPKIPVSFSKSPQSSTDFRIVFYGPSRKQLKFKALYYTYEGTVECINSRSKKKPQTHHMTLDLPMVTSTGQSDGVFYLDDA
ncbi:hypothetical protein DSO57_1013983 [Entomophthora muscae]|uniref:Uncharacterized protein n=1 Tax=Entomophthora muscae TaxID=34485 RepID=A0ACC2TT01_9FUNG|nr:hypothetical protein DSO57_1013983 [Entomophthora muscae]